MKLVFDNRNDWLAERRNGLGGSEVAAILGFDSYTSPFKVYWDKITPSADRKPSVAMLRGITLEPLIIKLFQDANPDFQIDYNPNTYTLYVDDNNPWRRGTPDAEYLSDISIPGIVECKSTSGNNQHIWYNGIPTKYKIQTVYYQNLVEVEEGYIAYLIDDTFLYGEVKATPEYRQMIYNAADKFWAEHIMKQVPPEPTTLDDIKHAYMDTIRGSIMEASAEFVDRLAMYSSKKDVVKTLEFELKSARLELEELEKLIRDDFGRHEFATWEGEVVARLQAWGKGRRLTVHNYKPLDEILSDD